MWADLFLGNQIVQLHQFLSSKVCINFRIGGESLAVAQNNYAVLWFKGKELNMVFGLQLSISRIGSTVNFWVMGSLYKFVKDSDLTGTKVLGVALFIGNVNKYICLQH